MVIFSEEGTMGRWMGGQNSRRMLQLTHNHRSTVKYYLGTNLLTTTTSAHGTLPPPETHVCNRMGNTRRRWKPRGRSHLHAVHTVKVGTGLQSACIDRYMQPPTTYLNNM